MYKFRNLVWNRGTPSGNLYHAMSKPRIFFCFGPPKSGTTLLQRCLDYHPDIACPSEQHLDYLAESLSKLFTEYNRGLLVTDRRTGGQGAIQIQNETVLRTFRSCVLEIMMQCQNGKPIVGLHDNSILKHLRDFQELFPEAKFICIFRHPILQARSAWHHNLKTSEIEGSAFHQEHVLKYGSIEKWTEFIANEFNDSVRAYRAILEGKPKAMFLLYEDLVRSKEKSLRRLFRFLGAKLDAETIRRIDEASSFETMKKGSNQPHFFRSGQTSVESPDLSSEFVSRINQIIAESCDFLGMPRTHLADHTFSSTNDL